MIGTVRTDIRAPRSKTFWSIEELYEQLCCIRIGSGTGHQGIEAVVEAAERLHGHRWLESKVLAGGIACLGEYKQAYRGIVAFCVLALDAYILSNVGVTGTYDEVVLIDSLDPLISCIGSSKDNILAKIGFVSLAILADHSGLVHMVRKLALHPLGTGS